MKKEHFKFALVLGMVFILAGVLVACGPKETPVPVVEATACPEVAPCPEVPEGAAVDAPFAALWAESAHADAESEAFRHWDEEDPQEIPAACAKCHSSTGFQDYVGADGTAAGAVDANAAIGTVVTCTTCHNEGTSTYSSVTFPSGKVVDGLGREAVCMTCHQGSASKVQVDEKIAALGEVDQDAVAADLTFTNIHYFAAAVARNGTLVQGGYEYEGKAYDAMFDHVEGVQTCTDCHDSHSLELKLDTCASCHTGVASVEDLRDLRFLASSSDYDGDGDVEEGVAFEIEGLQEKAYAALKAYSAEVAGTPMVYSSAAYPYFFVDTNADGELAEDEAQFANSYKSWTPRMLKAAYNLQTSIKDPGGYAHGGKYII